MQNLSDTFAVLTPALSVEPVAVTPDLYPSLERDFNRFKGHVLVSRYSFDRDWGSWERHPAGDEIVLLLSGRADMVLEHDGREEVVALRKAGDYLVVPRGRWHTARVAEPATMLFITPGEGTEHRNGA